MNLLLSTGVPLNAHIAQVRFVEWTADGRLRHAAFLGLQTTKPRRRFGGKRSGFLSLLHQSIVAGW
ncbi:MAG: hypothetical protein M3545_06045 [Acidobacteriota bacterium]|nr:hypothetical protein [Acidobacteriota bacterium]